MSSRCRRSLSGVSSYVSTHKPAATSSGRSAPCGVCPWDDGCSPRSPGPCAARAHDADKFVCDCLLAGSEQERVDAHECTSVAVPTGRFAMARRVDRVSYLTAGTRLRSVDAAITAAGRITSWSPARARRCARRWSRSRCPSWNDCSSSTPSAPCGSPGRFLPAMRPRGSGQIVYVSSMLGRIVAPLLSGYATSNWALQAIAETLAVEAKPFGIKVSILQLGGVPSGARRASAGVPCRRRPLPPHACPARRTARRTHDG